jgi:hypothetical protein
MATGGAADAPQVQHRHERITLNTERQRITGTVTLARDGYRSRLSDLLNASEREFISVTDAVIEPLDGLGKITMHPFVAVHRSHIVFATPHGEVEPEDIVA